MKNERENSEKEQKVQAQKYAETTKMSREKDDEFTKKWSDLKNQILEIQDKITQEKNALNAEMKNDENDLKTQVQNLMSILKSLQDQHEIEK